VTLYHHLLLLLLQAVLPQLLEARWQNPPADTAVHDLPFQQTQQQPQAQILAPHCLPGLLVLLDQEQHQQLLLLQKRC
jgi:hypothetical protein